MDSGGATGGTSKPDLFFLERKLQDLKTRRDNPDTPIDKIGALGLNLLHEPSECLVDFIFVHGLRGGSRKTWSASSSSAQYWPKEWLPVDASFKNVRIHSFGYNADWLDRHENPLNIHDFGQSLIEEMQSSPHIRRDKKTRIVFIGHSMGGLVIKKACILSRENPVFHDLGARIHSIYFLATPHRGSDLAQTLSKLVRVTFRGQKPFVGSLERGSETINMLNDQFRHLSQSIAIHSFIESIPTEWLSALIVDMQSATLGYPDERVQSLNATHRSICKFDSPEDPNYRTLRNRLSSTVEDIEYGESKSRPQKTKEEMRILSKYLNFSRSPLDDLASLEEARMPGSCVWLTSKDTFSNWQFNENSPRYLWLTGQPAMGKSVTAAHVISCMEGSSCSYYFFNNGEKDRSSLSGLLLSLAYQMAQKDCVIRERLLELAQDDSLLDKNDYRSIWRRLFVGGIFHAEFKFTHYWVIDGLDECIEAEKGKISNFFAVLGKINLSIPLKIFISSRPSVDLERLFTTLPVVNIRISIEDSVHDIRLFVESHAVDLPAEDAQTRENLVETIIRKSAGCFLWTVLVMQQLQDIYSSDEIEEVLREVPEEMDALYSRNLQIMSSKTRHKELAQAVLKWTLCATRALTIEELKHAIWLDLKVTVIRDLEKSISTLCSQFVFVDKNSRAHIVHETARTFLMNPNLKSDFRVQTSLGNVQLGLACFEYLTSDDIDFSKKDRRSKAPLHESGKTALASYACLSFSEHMIRSTSSSDPLFLALITFLRTNILVWIERMAQADDLDCLLRTARHLKAYRARRSKYAALLQDDIGSWTTDLPRIVTEFGTNLSKRPAAIHDLIPPLCPQNSSIFGCFGGSERGIKLSGLSNLDWNDRISCSNYGKAARCIACQDQWFAIGFSDGIINIYSTSTCQEYVHIDHGEPLRIIRFGHLAKLLVSTSLRTVKMWDVSTGSQLWEYRMESDPLSVDFDENDNQLVVATRSKAKLTWSAHDGILVSNENWYHNLPQDYSHLISRAPSTVIISLSHKLMAIVYRSRPLCLWDLETQDLLGFCTKRLDGGRDTSNNIFSVCFNPVQVLNLLAVSYMDGDVAIFDTISRKMKCHASIDTQLLAASPDGRTLAGGDSSGNIKLFDFESLQLLYHVSLSTDGITALAFTGDSLRLIDLRGAQINVWEPSALVRQWDYSSGVYSDISSDATMPLINGTEISSVDQTKDITNITMSYSGDFVICGRENGQVDICDISSTKSTFHTLYKHKASISIFALDWNETQKIVASVDAANRVKVVRLCRDVKSIIIVCDELLEVQISSLHLVKQLLISPDGTRLLVSSLTTDFVWSLQTGKLAASQEAESRIEWRWFTNPQNIAEIILLENSMLQYFLWESSEALSAIAEVAIAMGERQPLDFENIMVNAKSNTLVMRLSPLEAQISSTSLCSAKNSSLYTLDLSASFPLQQLLLPAPIFQSHGGQNLSRVINLLGTVSGAFSSRLLVFMEDSGWVCTADLDGPAPISSFQRHFFIPSAWLSTNVKIISVVTERKDVIFVRGHEIAVIKNGLEVAETISMS